MVAAAALHARSARRCRRWQPCGRSPSSIEDLHWADATTLDLLEHLLAAGPGLPVVGTWRKDDPTVPAPVHDWLSRVHRLPAVGELALGPLTRDGTAEQLALLTGAAPDPASVDRIYRRTAGQPLFTEQLAAQADGQPMPQAPGGAAGPPPRRPRSRGVVPRSRARGRGPRVSTTVC